MIPILSKHGEYYADPATSVQALENLSWATCAMVGPGKGAEIEALWSTGAGLDAPRVLPSGSTHQGHKGAPFPGHVYRDA